MFIVKMEQMPILKSVFMSTLSIAQPRALQRQKVRISADLVSAIM